MKMYQVDAFADVLFSGNPAAICPLGQWLDDALMQKIAAENNLSETAFFVGGNGHYDLRWFTPVVEVDLCGHATLASAYVVFNYLEPEINVVEFSSRSGLLSVRRNDDCLEMDFPAESVSRCDAPDELVAGLGVMPDAVFRGRDYMVVIETEQQLCDLKPDFRLLAQLDLRGIIVTAPGVEVDFVSRFFAPNAGIDEDPVTGSAHCALVPYWAQRLGRKVLKARQLSDRGGTVLCRLDDRKNNGRVSLAGQCAAYMVADLLMSQLS